MARIKREIEEVRELSRRQDGEAQGDDKEDEAEALSKLLDGLETRGKLPAPAANLQASLATPLPPSSIPPTFDSADSKPAIDAAATYTVSYAPNYSTSHTLALTTSFESRLHAVESALGLPQTLSSAPSPPLLSTLDQMAKKLALLTTMTPAQVDALSRRVRALTAESERLAAAKLAARQSGLSGDSTESEGGEAKSEVDEEAKGEQEARINALYGTLSTIETLSPLLPGVLERLRSLRQVHSGAAEVKQELDEAMRKQQEMEKEIGRWREGLEKVEKAVVEAEKTGGENVKAVEGWVRELEEKVKSLDS